MVCVTETIWEAALFVLGINTSFPYAFQDREDDSMLGVKSLPLLLVGPPLKRVMDMSIADRARTLGEQQKKTQRFMCYTYSAW